MACAADEPMTQLPPRAVPSEETELSASLRTQGAILYHCDRIYI